MKKILSMLACMAALVLLFQSCKKEKALTFEYHGEKITMKFLPRPNTPLVWDTIGRVYFNADSMAKANKFPSDALDEITMTDVEFTLLNAPANINFDVIKSMSAKVYAIDPNNSIPVFDNGYITSKTGDKIIVSGVEGKLKNIVYNNKEFFLNVSGELNQAITQPITVQVYFTYKVSFKGFEIKG
jgi:hypothetical protein